MPAAAKQGRLAPRHTVLCETCGSLSHHTAGCMGRDDIVLGTTVPSSNGEYRGSAPVRVLPPGFSYLDRASSHDVPMPAAGQLWFDRSGRRYVVTRVTGRIVSLNVSPKPVRFLFDKARVRVSTLRAKWTFGGMEVEP